MSDLDKSLDDLIKSVNDLNDKMVIVYNLMLKTKNKNEIATIDIASKIYRIGLTLDGMVKGLHEVYVSIAVLIVNANPELITNMLGKCTCEHCVKISKEIRNLN